MDSPALRMLLVEDIPVNSELEALVFRRAHFDVTTVETGEEALEALQRERFDVVALDIRLPGLDGIEVVRRIRADPRTADLPVVAITAMAMAGDRERALQAGFDAYITKPVSPGTLADTIASAMRDRGRSHGPQESTEGPAEGP